MRNIKRLLPFVAIFALLSCQNEVIHKTTVYVNFDYSGHRVITDPETGDQIIVATPLFGYSYYNFGKEDSKKIPALEYDYLIPGDRFYFEHIGSGEIICLESYPASCSLLDGSLISAQYFYTNIVEIDADSIVRNESGGIKTIYNYDAYDRYVIISEDLRFVSLEEYTGETLFGSEDLSRALPCGNGTTCIPRPLALGALFSFNPRPQNDI